MDSRRFGSHAIEPCSPCETMGAEVAIACAALRARIRTGKRLPFSMLRAIRPIEMARNIIEREMSLFLPDLMIDWSKLDVVPVAGTRPTT